MESKRRGLVLLWLATAAGGCAQAIAVAQDATSDGREAGAEDARADASGGDGATAVDGGFADAAVGDAQPQDACTPQCGGRQCGADPACGVSCGMCDPGQSCSSAGACLDGCAPGSLMCTGDQSGFQPCGYNPALGIADLGPRVPCAPGEACGEAGCSHSSCLSAEVMLVVDRSASMSFNSTWIWVRDAILSAVSRRDQANTFGLRILPFSACMVSPPVPPQVGARGPIAAGLLAPDADDSTPIQAALTGLASSFGPGRDGQAVILVTDGDESCGSADGAVEQASRLFRGGVRTFVVGIHNTADPVFLDRLAAAGGTRRARRAQDLSTLTATLGAVFAELGACTNRRAQVGAGTYHTCGLRVDGTLACWGRDLSGESSPPGGSFTHLAVGGAHSCAIRNTGEVACWGRNDRGQLVAPAGSFRQLALGDQHSCGLRLDGTAACWGYDDANQASPPSGVFKSITCGGFFSCGVRMDDSVECWGGSFPGRPQVPVYAIDGGAFHWCAILGDRSLDCAGRGGVPGGRFSRVSAGDDHDCGLREDGTLACWGMNNGWGQLDAPAGQYVDVTANYNHSCAVRESDDGFVCWGYDGDGQATPPP
jgi:hypothetical protein